MCLHIHKISLETVDTGCLQGEKLCGWEDRGGKQTFLHIFNCVFRILRYASMLSILKRKF